MIAGKLSVGKGDVYSKSVAEVTLSKYEMWCAMAQLLPCRSTGGLLIADSSRPTRYSV